MRTALVFLASFAELGRCNRRQIAKLAGLAPFNRDLRPVARPAPHRPRPRPIRHAQYQAAVAVARKLLVFLNRLLANDPSSAAA